MPARPLGKVFTLQLIPPAQPTLFGPQAHVIEVLQGGNRITRYGRTWIVGPVTTESGALVGRLGFQGNESVTELWDEEAGDFVGLAIPTGMTAPFAVDLGTLRASVQVRPPLIRINSIIGALEQLLSEGGERWKVRGMAREMPLDVWLASVTRVTTVRMIARVPNPHYHGEKDLESLMESSEAEAISLEIRADGGVNIHAPFIRQTQNHIDRGYGEARYVGEVEGLSGTRESVYSTKLAAEEVSDGLPVDEQGEVPSDLLRNHLARAQEQLSREEGEAGDDRGAGNPFHPPS